MTLETASGILLLIAAGGCVGSVIEAVRRKHSQRYLIAFASLVFACIDFGGGAGLLHIIRVEHEGGRFSAGLEGLTIAAFSFYYNVRVWTAILRNEEIPGGEE